MKKPVIFLIDDEDVLRELLTEIFRDENYEVFDFSDGLVAFEQARARYSNQENIDFILTDVNMPSVSGVKLVQKFRELGLQCPIVLFSGESGEEFERLKAIPGVSGVEQKPYVTNVLLSHVSDYIGRTGSV